MKDGFYHIPDDEGTVLYARRNECPEALCDHVRLIVHRKLYLGAQVLDVFVIVSEKAYELSPGMGV